MFIFNFVVITTSKYLVVVFHIVHYEPDAPTTDHGTAGQMGTLVEVLSAQSRECILREINGNKMICGEKTPEKKMADWTRLHSSC